MAHNVQKLPARRSRAVLSGVSEANEGGNFFVMCRHALSAPLPRLLARRIIRIYVVIAYVQGEAMSSKKKLTLSVDEQVIERARRYSVRHKTSISQLVTTYLSRLDSPSDLEFSPLVRRLRGILPHDVEIEEYHRYLEEKYS